MKKLEAAILGATFVLAGILMVSHHFIVSGRFFDTWDILHHEFFEAIAFTAGIILLLISLFDKK